MKVVQQILQAVAGWAGFLVATLAGLELVEELAKNPVELANLVGVDRVTAIWLDLGHAEADQKAFLVGIEDEMPVGNAHHMQHFTR